jgi:hypothetical protein
MKQPKETFSVDFRLTYLERKEARTANKMFAQWWGDE